MTKPISSFFLFTAAALAFGCASKGDDLDSESHFQCRQDADCVESGAVCVEHVCKVAQPAQGADAGDGGGNGDGGPPDGSSGVLACPLDGLSEGNAAISGVKSVDTYLASVLDFSSSSLSLADALDVELSSIASSLGLPQDALTADIFAGLQAKLAANTTDGLHEHAGLVRCHLDVPRLLEGLRDCDPSAGAATAVSCEGDCGSPDRTCGAEATTVCVDLTPTEAPCQGTCTGTCKLTAPSACTGTCKGTCDGRCSVKAANGECNGPCDGDCAGSCEMGQGGVCAGSCAGSCEAAPPSAACAAGKNVICRAMAGESVECSTECDGAVIPPRASSECEASTTLTAAAAICATPEISGQFVLTPLVDDDGSAENDFLSWLDKFERHVSTLVAFGAVADRSVNAGSRVAVSAASIAASIDAQLEGDVPIATKVGLGCAKQELPEASRILQASLVRLAGVKTACTAILDAVR